MTKQELATKIVDLLREEDDVENPELQESNDDDELVIFCGIEDGYVAIKIEGF